MRATVHSFFAHHQRQRMVASGEQCRLSRAGISCNRRSQAKRLHVSHSYNKYTNITTSLNWSLQSDAKRCSMRQVINITKAEPRSITVSYYPLGYAIVTKPTRFYPLTTTYSYSTNLSDHFDYHITFLCYHVKSDSYWKGRSWSDDLITTHS